MDSVLVSAEATGAALLLLLPPTAPAADCSCPSVDRRVAPAAGGNGVEEEEVEEEGGGAAPTASSEFTAVKIESITALEGAPEDALCDTARRVFEVAVSTLLSTGEPWDLGKDARLCREFVMPAATAVSTEAEEVSLLFWRLGPTLLSMERPTRGLSPEVPVWEATLLRMVVIVPASRFTADIVAGR